ncbi:MAG: potassium-transporting ATPase subunit KdpA [Dehalococcoidia bacterium]|nr:potassium-transporting ATPase subunit KdpA [Dehalococcoidia bacterium]
MTLSDTSFLIVYVAVLVAIARPLGLFMMAVYEGRRTLLHPVIRPLEAGIYRVAGIDERREQGWRAYLFALLGFNLAGFLLLYFILRVQGSLPLNPENLPGMKPSLAFNAAVSFTTNTNWQSDGGETTASYFSQMVGFTFQNFVSAAVGMAVLVALIRGLSRHSANTVGNFWVDLTRGTLYILLPMSFIFALFLVSQGVIQNFDSYRSVTTVEGAEQVLAMGPAASQVAIKQLGTNGGGFFNANSAVPFENPTAWTNLLEMLAILIIPAGLVYMYGKMVGSTRHGWIVFGVMTTWLVIMAVVANVAEQSGNSNLADAGVTQDAGDGQPGGNMEGKEVRFGIGQSTLWANATTLASNGSVNSMHDSYTPLGGLVPMVNMLTSEVIFGGVGSGMYGMVIYIILAVFIAGLMVGRTPEYLGKKIEAREMKAVMLGVLAFSLVLLTWTAVGAVNSFGTDTTNNLGPHGFSEIFYAFTSGAANNGSAFAGLGVNGTFYNVGIGVCMLVGRFLFIVPVMVIAGSMAAKKRVAPGPGTFPTDGLVFGGLLFGVIVIVGLLTFFPAISLGPVVEHFMLRDGLLS